MKSLYFNILISTFFVFNSAFPQKFSNQIYTSPILLNPANTGNFIADYRVGGISRTETSALGNDLSYVFSFDSRLFKNVIDDKDKLAIGISALSESDRYFGLFNKSAFLSIAYFKGLNENGDEKIGIGFQVASVTKTKESPNYIFTDQVENAASNGFIGLNFYSPRISVSYLDFNAGISYQKLIEAKHLISLGVSISHITRPQQKLDGGEFTINPLLGFQGVSEIQLVDKSKLLTNFNLKMGLDLKDLQTLSIGCLYQQDIGQTSYKISGGTFFRTDQVYGTIFSPTIGLKIKRLNLLMSYDLTLSKEVYKRKNAFEIGIFYTSMFKNESK